MINLWASKSREPGQGCTLRGSLPAPGSLPAGQVPRQGRASEPPWGPQTPSKGLASAQGSPPATALFFPWKLALRCWGHRRRGRRPGQPHPSGVSKEHCLSLSELHHSLLRKEAWGPRDPVPSFIILNSKNLTVEVNMANPDGQDFSRKVKAIFSRKCIINLGPNVSYLPFITQRVNSG